MVSHHLHPAARSGKGVFGVNVIAGSAGVSRQVVEVELAVADGDGFHV